MIVNDKLYLKLTIKRMSSYSNNLFILQKIYSPRKT